MGKDVGPEHPQISIVSPESQSRGVIQLLFDLLRVLCIVNVCI